MCHLGFLWELRETMHVKAVNRGLEHSECSVHGSRPAAVPPHPSTMWAGNSESAPQLRSKVLDAALSGDRADFPHPCRSLRSRLPAGSPPHRRGEQNKSPGQGDTLAPLAV